MTTATSLLLTVIGVCLTLVGTLIVLNLRSIKKCVSTLVVRIDGVESDHKRLARDFAACKIDSERSYVSKEDCRGGRITDKGFYFWEPAYNRGRVHI